MLSQMRSASKSWLVYLAFGVLIIVFTFYFGPGSDGCQPSSRERAAVVNGESLYNVDIDILMNRFSRNRGRLNDAEYIKLQTQVLQKLSLLYLLSDNARERGFEVGKEELSRFILDPRRNVDYRNYSDKDGRFDAENYERFVAFGLTVTVEDYERFKQRELLAYKYLSSLEGTLSVLPKEAEELSKLRNTKVDLEFVRFDPKQLASAVSVTDEQIAAFNASNAADVKKYFEDNKKNYEEPKRVRIRRLMVKKGDDKKAEDNWKTAKDRVLTKKEAFEAVVKDLSDDIAYRDKGGDMGWSDIDNMNQDMAKVVDGMKQGDVKEYESNFARFLLKLEEVKEAKTSSLAEVSKDIARKLLSEKEAAKQIEGNAAKLLKAAQTAPTKSLEDVLKGLKPAEPVEEANKEGEAGEEKKEGEESKEKAPTKESFWDKVRVANTGKYSRTPRQSYSFDQETKKLVPASLPWNDIPRIGKSTDLAQAAFKLTTESPVYGQLHKNEGAFFVIRLKERTEPKADEAAKNLRNAQRELERGVYGSYLSGWQTIIYRPEAELKDASPWLSTLWDDAVRTGKIQLDAAVFGTPAAAEPTEDAKKAPEGK